MTWTLHRRILTAALDSDPLDPGTTTPSWDNPVQVSKGARLLWRAVAMTATSTATGALVDPNGLTVDGSLVLVHQERQGGRSRYPLLSEGGGSQVAAGVLVEEGPLPQDGVGLGYIHIPAITNPGAIAAIWIWYTEASRVGGEG